MDLDWNFLDGGYFVKENGTPTNNVRPELISDSAKEFGNWFATRKKPSSNQLRDFYGDAKSLETKMRGSNVTITPQSFRKHEYLVRMLKAKVAYAYGKETGRFVPIEFKKFIDKCVDLIQNEKDFEAFMKFFESMVGFYYGKAGEIVAKEKQEKRGRK